MGRLQELKLKSEANKRSFPLVWEFGNQKLGLSEDIVEQLKLVNDMEHDVSSKKSSSQGLMKQIASNEKELTQMMERQVQLNVASEESQTLKNQLDAKMKCRAEKLKAHEKREQLKKETYENSKDSTYVDRAEEFLGLRIAKTDNQTTIISFNKIDSSDESRTFVCEFEMNAHEGGYKVLKCEPQIDDLAKLETKLNETNDLSGFVSCLRKAFKQKSQK